MVKVLMRGDRETMKSVSAMLYDMVAGLCDAQPGLQSMDAGRIATQCQKYFERVYTKRHEVDREAIHPNQINESL